MPKILYYGGFILPDRNAAAQRVVGNSKLFKLFGYDTIFLGFSNEIDENNRIFPEPSSPQMYSEAYPKSTNEWIIRLLNPRNLFNLADAIDDLKIIIMYNLPLYSTWMIKRYCKKRNISLIYDCTEWSSYTEGGLLKRIVKKIDYISIRYLLPYIIKNIISISSLMQTYYRRNANSVKIPPLIDVNDSIWKQERINSDKFVFCFSGEIGCKKEAVDSIVKAYRRVENSKTELQIIGLSKEEFINKYPSIDVSNVIFKGRLSHVQTVRFVSSCGCFVFLRENNIKNNAGFPTKFVEAYTCGVPIITTCVSDLKDYQDGNRVHFTSSSIEDIVEKMRMVIKEHPNQFSISDTFDYKKYYSDVSKWLSNIN